MLARYARNRRLGDAVHQWAFCALSGSPGARAYYQTLRDRGIGHQAALRQLGNRLVGILHGCLKTRTSYDEATAWAHHPTRRLTPRTWDVCRRPLARLPTRTATGSAATGGRDARG